MRSNKFTGCFILLILVVEVQCRISLSVSNSLSKISTRMGSIGKNVQSRVDKITEALNSEEGGEMLDAVSGSIERIAGAVDSVTSSEVLTLLGGTMEMVSAITSLIPGYGQIVSLVFGLVGSVLGGIGGSEDIGSVVRREIENALNTYDDSNLRAEAEGTMRVFRNSQAFMSKGETGPLSETDIIHLTNNVPIYQGVDFLGVLSSKIGHYSDQTDYISVMRSAEYVKLYVSLAVMRTAILWEMYSLVRESGHSDFLAGGINRTIYACQDNDEASLDFLTKPAYSKATFFAFYRPSDWPVVKNFLSKIGKSFQNLGYLSNQPRSFRPESWDTNYMKMEGNLWGQMQGTGDLYDGSLFYFDVISAENNIFFLRSKQWPTWYVIMDSTGNCRGWGSAPGTNGQWKVTLFIDGKYMLSPLDNPNRFMYMRHDAWGHVRGWDSDPGGSAHWIIE